MNLGSDEKRWDIVVWAATLLTAIGAVGQYFVVYRADHSPIGTAHLNLVAFLAVWLEMPGLVFAFAVAAIFSRGHDPGGLIWLAIPATWFFYLGVGALWIRRQRRRAIPHSNEVKTK